MSGCQYAWEIAPGLYIGVAADGVGSARHSDIASGLATEKLVEYLERHIRADYGIDEKKVCLKAGFQYAEKAIEEYVQDCDDMLNEYDTTLHVVLYDGRTVVYGHAGDGGILVGLCPGDKGGDISAEKDLTGVSVMPLRAGGNRGSLAIFRKEWQQLCLLRMGSSKE